MAVRRLTRAESAARTRSRLVAAAQRVFFERGFHGASLEAVAEEAGLTKGAVYSRFESKADLFLAYQEERNKQTVERVGERLAELGQGDWPLDVIIEHWENRLLHESLEQSLLVIEFWASACRDPEVHRRFSDQHERVMAGVAEHLDQTATRLGVTLPLPALELVRVSTGIAHGLALEQLMNREKVDARMIELAFTPIHELSPPGASAALRAARSDGRVEQRSRDGGTRPRRGR
jgi:AcrR family transcriptional regulator